MSFVEHAVIAAAGMGTRLGMGVPKCLVEICGRKLIEYQLDLLKDVPNVYMVVGFCERDVIKTVGQLRRDVVFVRNPNFQHTKTLESYYLAARVITGNAIFMDGDMILEPESFAAFLANAVNREFLVGVTRRISDDPVYASISLEQGNLMLQNFSCEESSMYEWANVVYMPADRMKSGMGHVFQHLQTMLPLPAAVLDRLEIDTHTDLKLAEEALHAGFFSMR